MSLLLPLRTGPTLYHILAVNVNVNFNVGVGIIISKKADCSHRSAIVFFAFSAFDLCGCCCCSCCSCHTTEERAAWIVNLKSILFGGLVTTTVVGQKLVLLLGLNGLWVVLALNCLSATYGKSSGSTRKRNINS